MLRYFDQCIVLQGTYYRAFNIGAINVCTNFEMNRYKIDEFRNRLFYLMSYDAKTVRRTSWR